MVELQKIAPSEIEAESFRIIEREFSQQTGFHRDDFTPEEFKVIQRVIHATGDFTIAQALVFQNDPIRKGLQALREGGNILTDVNMVASGISKSILAKFGGKVVCRLGEPETSELARSMGTTRTEAAMTRAADDNIAIVAVGNAPTGLLSVLKMIREGAINPGLIVGVPVGFVNAEESKEILLESSIPAITVRGRRGGSPIAAAITNAILRLA